VPEKTATFAVEEHLIEGFAVATRALKRFNLLNLMTLHKKLLMALAISTCVWTGVEAQTARRIHLLNSSDNESTIDVFLPENPTGRAIVDCPGGGYVNLAMYHEGYDWAEFFNNQGIAYCVLKYRMPKGNKEIPLSDAYRAMKTMRDSAEVWHVNPHDVGIMGFSAGGHLASSVSTHAPWESRPDFSILFYPVISMNADETHRGSCEQFLGEGQTDQQQVHDWTNYNAVYRHLTPPAIILMAADDDVVDPLNNGVKYYEALRNAGTPCAMYIYPSGGHGFGFRESYAYHDQMLTEISTWLKNLKAPKAESVRVACIGNSITDGYGIDMCEVQGYPAQLQNMLGDDYCVKNFGVGGRTMLNKGDYPYMNELAWRDALDFCPDVAIVKLGTNDSKPENWQYGKEFATDMQQMIDSLKALPTKPRILLATPIPAFAPTWNISDSVIVNEIIPVIRKLAKKNKLEIIELHDRFNNNDGQQVLPDAIHPSAQGAKQMADIIYEYLKK
jgi:acetyl esterase/lipase/lysophospholipase L1-like esterase